MFPCVAQSEIVTLSVQKLYGRDVIAICLNVRVKPPLFHPELKSEERSHCENKKVSRHNCEKVLGIKMFSHEFWNKTACLSNPHLNFTARLLLREDLCFWLNKDNFIQTERTVTAELFL